MAMCHFVPRNVYRVISIMLWGLLLAFSVVSIVSVATSKPQPEHFELKLLQLLFVLFLLVLVVVHECRDINLCTFRKVARLLNLPLHLTAD